MQAQTAQKAGIIDGSNFTKLTSLKVGSEVELYSAPEYSTHEEYGEQLSIETNVGTLQTNNRNTIAQFKSKKEKSIGGALKTQLAKGEGLTVFVRELDTTTGRKQIVLSTL